MTTKVEKVYPLYAYDKKKKKDMQFRMTVAQAKEYKQSHDNVILFISKEDRILYKEGLA